MVFLTIQGRNTTTRPTCSEDMSRAFDVEAKALLQRQSQRNAMWDGSTFTVTLLADTIRRLQVKRALTLWVRATQQSKVRAEAVQAAAGRMGRVACQVMFEAWRLYTNALRASRHDAQRRFRGRQLKHAVVVLARWRGSLLCHFSNPYVS
jgi:hypothetical protein